MSGSAVRRNPRTLDSATARSSWISESCCLTTVALSTSAFVRDAVRCAETA